MEQERARLTELLVEATEADNHSYITKIMNVMRFLLTSTHVLHRRRLREVMIGKCVYAREHSSDKFSENDIDLIKELELRIHNFEHQ